MRQVGVGGMESEKTLKGKMTAEDVEVAAKRSTKPWHYGNKEATKEDKKKK